MLPDLAKCKKKQTIPLKKRGRGGGGEKKKYGERQWMREW